MTAPLCPRCHGNPHRYEAGCVSCGDSGYERAPERSEDDEERIAAMYREEERKR